jgi:hypothetical protein
VSRCLRRLVEWDAPILGLGMVVIPKLLLERLSGKVDEATFETWGREMARDFLKPATIYSLGEFTLGSVVEVLRRTSVYSGRFNFDFGQGSDSRKRVVVLRHDQGRLWSRYYMGLLDETFKVLLGEEMTVAYTDSLCIAQLTTR